MKRRQNSLQSTTARHIISAETPVKKSLRTTQNGTSPLRSAATSEVRAVVLPGQYRDNRSARLALVEIYRCERIDDELSFEIPTEIDR